MLALATDCQYESVDEQCQPCKGGPFKITFPETTTHHRPDKCVSNCSWNGTEENLCKTCIPVLGCPICKNRLTRLLLSNPFEYNSQWKITPLYIQDVDETFCDRQRKRIQILRKKKECDPNDSLANDIANYKSKTKLNGYKLHKTIGKSIGEKNKENSNQS